MTYSINAWGSHPDLNNDDCYSGEDVDDFEAAVETFQRYCKESDYSIQYIEIDGPDFYQVTKAPNYSAKECKLQDSLDSSEGRMQAGMMGGCEAYNDYCE